MVNSKKLLSLFLAVVMVFSALTVMASAYSVGSDVENGINYKYTVEKVDFVPETAAGSVEWHADNLYAVTLWMKASLGVDVINTTLHYNKALFAPITLSDGDCTYPYGAGLDQDTYYSDMGEGAVYAYSFGDYMNNTGMYTATGATAKTQALAKCIGLGNANAAAIEATPQLISPDHPNYSKYGAGLPADTGVMSIWLAVSGAKTAYFNTIEGINFSTDWNQMFTLYFEAIADDVTGAEFGIFTEDAYTVDGNVDGSGLGYHPASGYKAQAPAAFNISGNAIVEASAPSSPVYHVKNQVQAGKEAGTINIGVVAGFDIADIDIQFNEKGTSTNVQQVGAVVTIGDGTPATNYERFVYLANGGASYYFRAVIEGIPADYAGGDIVVTPLVWMEGEDTPIYGEAVTITAADVAAYAAKIPA